MAIGTLLLNIGLERIETWEYPIDAIREAITNKMNVMMQKRSKKEAEKG